MPANNGLGLFEKRRVFVIFAALFVLSLLLRFIAMYKLPLLAEEAYYWMYSQHPALSYYDHPPMIAWVIKLGTSAFGNTHFGIRVVGQLLMLASSVLIYIFAKEWFGRRAAILSAVFIQVLPTYYGAGFIATMDSQLIFFWLVCMIGVTWAVKYDRAWGWYLAGVGVGGAMLSKYTGVFLGAGIFAALACYKPWRKHLLSPRPYIAALIALALFSPVIIWNMNNDYASFRFQLTGRFDDEGYKIYNVFMYLFYQAAVLTPLALVMFFVLLPRLAKSKRRLFTPRWIIALCFCLPLMLLFYQKSLKFQIHVNWILPLFLSFFPAIALLIYTKRRWFRAAVVWTFSICVILNVLIMSYGLFFQPRAGWLPGMGPWKKLARIVEEYEDKLEETGSLEPLIICDGRYRLASLLAFYRLPIEDDSKAPQFTTNQWIVGDHVGLNYEYWMNPEKWAGRNCLYIYEKDSALEKIKTCFDSIEIVDDTRLTFRRGHEYRLAICRGFKPQNIQK